MPVANAPTIAAPREDARTNTPNGTGVTIRGTVGPSTLRITALEITVERWTGSAWIAAKSKVAKRANTSDGWTVGNRFDGSFTGLTRRTNHRLRIRAESASGWGAWSGWRAFRTNAKAKPINPTHTRGTLTPTLGVGIESADPSEALTGVREVITETTPAGTVTRWDSGKVEIGGTPTRSSLAYGGESLAWGGSYRRRTQVWDRDGEPSDLVDMGAFPIEQVAGPTITPADTITRQPVRPTWTIAYGATFDRLRVQAFTDEGCSGTPVYDSGLVAVTAGTSRTHLATADLPRATTVHVRAFVWLVGATDPTGPGLAVPEYIAALPTACTELAPGGPSLAESETVSGTTPTLTCVGNHPDAAAYGATLASYAVEVWAGDLSGSALRSASGLASPSWAVTPALTSGTAYALRWRATDDLGNVAPWSAWVWITPQSPPTVAIVAPVTTVARDEVSGHDGSYVGTVPPTRGAAQLIADPAGSGTARLVAGATIGIGPGIEAAITAARTVFGWYRADNNDADTVVIVAAGTTDARLIRTSAGAVAMGWYDTGGAYRSLSSGAGALPAGQWGFVVGTHDGTNATVLVNGVVVAGPSAAYDCRLQPSGTQWRVGTLDIAQWCGAASWGPVGYLNACLTTAQLQALYASRTSGFIAAVTAYGSLQMLWPMDDTGGGTFRRLAGVAGSGTWYAPLPTAVAGPCTAEPGYSGMASKGAYTGGALTGAAAIARTAAWSAIGLIRVTDAMSDGMFVGCPNEAFYVRRLSNGQLTASWYDATPTQRAYSTPSGAVPADGLWHLVIATHDGATTSEIYVDNVLKASNSSYGCRLQPAPAAWRVLGGTASGSYHPRSMAGYGIGVLNRVITSGERATLQAAVGSARYLQALAKLGTFVGLWPCADPVGTALRAIRGPSGTYIGAGETITAPSPAPVAAYGASVVFDGVDRAVEQAVTIAAANFPIGPLTGVSARAIVRLDGQNGAATMRTIMNWGPQSSTNGYHWWYLTTTGQIAWQYSDGTAARTAQTTAPWLVDGQTYNLEVAHDYVAERVHFFVDGALAQTVDLSIYGAPVQVADDKLVYWGVYAGVGNWMCGAIAEPSISFETVTDVAAAAALEAARWDGRFLDVLRARPLTAFWRLAEDAAGVAEVVIDWTFSGSSAQATYEATVTADADGTVAWTSGVVVSDATAVTVPAGILATGTAYTVTVAATAANGLAGSASVSFTTRFGVPGAPASLAATPDAASSGVALAWPATTLPDAEFVAWRLYRADGPDAAAPELVAEITDRATVAHTDYGAPLGTALAYELRAYNGWAESPAATAAATLEPVTAGSWQLVIGGDPRLTLEFVRGGVRDASSRATAPVAQHQVIGRELPITEAGAFGARSGSLTLELWPGETHLAGRVAEIAAAAEPAWLKDQAGHARLVRITEVGEGILSAGRLSVPVSWVEVD